MPKTSNARKASNAVDQAAPNAGLESDPTLDAVDNAAAAASNVAVAAADNDEPQAPAKKKTKRSSASDHEKKPRAKNSFMFFCDDNRERIKAQHEFKSVVEVAKKLGEEWRALSAEDKVVYTTKAEEAKAALEQAAA